MPTLLGSETATSSTVEPEFVDNGPRSQVSSKVDAKAVVPINQDAIYTLNRLQEDLENIGRYVRQSEPTPG
jgi:hypothetical protein